MSIIGFHKQKNIIKEIIKEIVKVKEIIKEIIKVKEIVKVKVKEIVKEIEEIEINGQKNINQVSIVINQKDFHKNNIVNMVVTNKQTNKQYYVSLYP